jgi:hypothetical protein
MVDFGTNLLRNKKIQVIHLTFTDEAAKSLFVEEDHLAAMILMSCSAQEPPESQRHGQGRDRGRLQSPSVYSSLIPNTNQRRESHSLREGYILPKTGPRPYVLD